MIFGFPRPTAGYIRYLQTSAVQTVTSKFQDLILPRVAVVLGALGIAMSGYSSRQLTFHHRPSTRILQWMSRPAMNADSPGSPSAKARLAPANAGMASIKNDQQEEPIKNISDTQQPVKT
ncbi:uncharacterized protein LOC564090 [Danio rerio]|uniref:Uncharacterized protein LOC564090 n=1 Tax=Danio rerio TaxID=7955 RepID=B3DGQ8_DANRE|nr:uncharacterized protein LOC564090 [Danio rerio]AAI62485.1 Zgc:193593 [Danio rerio]AAI62492.1 Zgc:193593 [Danio rerio]|eukprot:NP_001122189.1 uncharacterized protein LOC564090 [Danio rerio]